MIFPNHQHPVEDLSNSGTIGRDLARSKTAAAALNIVLPSQTGNSSKVLGTDGTDASWVVALAIPVPVASGGTGATTFSAGVIVSPGGTTALTTITGNSSYLVKWSSNTLADSVMSESGGSMTQKGGVSTIQSQNAYNASPLATWKGDGQYNNALAVITFGQLEIGKENVTDWNTAGMLNLRTRTDGGSNTTRLSISSTGVVTISQLTASRPVYTDASKNLVSQTVAIADGGTGEITANLGLNALLPAQGASSGKFLKTDGTNTSWASETVAGAALTRVDDTNVTLTLGGTPTTALLVASSITAGWTGTLSVARGGTAGGTPDAALTQLLPSQAANAGKVLSTNGTVTSWIAAGSAGTVTSVTIGVPAAGITQSGSPITASGTITLALANDLLALEGLSGTGIAKRTGVDTWVLSAIPMVATDGGTGKSVYVVGDMLYANTTTTLAQLAVTANNAVLIQSAGIPTWTSTLQVVSGGTGFSTTSAGGLVYGATSALMTTLAIGTANYVLTSSGTLPQWTSVLGRVSGGTGLSTYAKGDLIYANATNNLANLALGGTVGHVLKVDASGVPAWGAAPGGVGTVTSIAISSTDLSVSGSPITSSGTFTLNINTAAVTLAKMADMATASFLGRNTASTGVPEVLSMTTARTMLGVAALTTKGDLLGFSTVPARIPISTDGFVLMADSTQTLGLKWATVAGAGTVTSVAMTVPSILSVAGSPITTSGTLVVTLATQTANYGFMGPASGAAVAPTFRALVSDDIPNLSAVKITSGAAALTSVSGTNVTLTVSAGGATALLAATSLTLGWSGQLSIGNGGTGQATANAAFNELVPAQAGNSGKFLTTNATNTSWGTVAYSVLTGSPLTATKYEGTSTGNTDYAITNTSATINFGVGGDLSVSIAAAGTYLVTSEFSINTASSCSFQFVLNGSVQGDVSNSVRNVYEVANNPIAFSMSSLVTTTGAETIRVRVKFLDVAVTTPVVLQSYNAFNHMAYVRYFRIA